MRSAPLYPVCLNILDRLCTVIGGGGVAERKVRGLLACGARVRVVSPACNLGLTQLGREGTVELRERPYEPDDLSDSFLIFAATDDPWVQEEISQEAKRRGISVNVADNPESCSFHVPAIHRQGNLVLTVATGGRSPALAALVRQQLAEQFGPEYGPLLELLGGLRSLLLAEQEQEHDVKNLFQQLLSSDIVTWVRQGRWDEVERHLLALLGRKIDVMALLRESQ